ncbi:MAG TPA: hypothetical protein VF706_05380, partial [Solirubrobacteraceae bacterium]
AAGVRRVLLVLVADLTCRRRSTRGGVVRRDGARLPGLRPRWDLLAFAPENATVKATLLRRLRGHG